MSKYIPIEELRQQYKDSLELDRGGEGINLYDHFMRKSEVDPLSPERQTELRTAQNGINSAVLKMSAAKHVVVLSTMLALVKHIAVPIEYAGFVVMGGDGNCCYYNELLVRKLLQNGPQGRLALNWMIANQAMRLAYRVHWDRSPFIVHELYPQALDLFVQSQLQLMDNSGRLFSSAPLEKGLPGVNPQVPEEALWHELLSRHEGTPILPANPLDKGKMVVEILNRLIAEQGPKPIAGASAQHNPSSFNTKGVTMSPAQQYAQLTSAVGRAIKAQKEIDKRGRGTDSGDGNPLLWKTTVPKVPWYTLLNEAIQEIFIPGVDIARYDRPHKISQVLDYVVPTAQSTAMGGLLLQVDVSGSALYALSQFMSEIAAMVKRVCPCHVTVLYVTTTIVKVQHFLPDDYDNIEVALQPVGNGGTDMRAAYYWLMNPDKRDGEYVSLEYEAMITFSDGETEYLPENEAPADVRSFWIIEGTDASEYFGAPPFGQTFYMNINDTHVVDDQGRN